MIMDVKDLECDGRAANGERYMGMEVAAYMEGPFDYGGRFSTHWSTPSKHREVIRLFSEYDVAEKIKELEEEIMRLKGFDKIF